MPTNKAAWMKQKQAHPFALDEAPMPVPGPNQVVVRAHAIAINPCDWVIQTHGVLLDNYPRILGEDVSGTIASIGSQVKDFSVGDNVLGCIDVTQSDSTKGTFQLYSAVNTGMLAKIPSNTTYTQASVLPLALSTAAASLYGSNAMALPMPSLQPQSNGKVLLIWAASTVVGSCAIQLAQASGYKVFATCSAKNKEHCRSLGATQVFDHHAESVVEDVATALRGKNVEGGFCAHVDTTALMKCARAISAVGAKKVGTVLPPTWPLPEDLPAGLAVTYAEAGSIQHTEVGKAIWGKWLTPALASGLMKCKPDPFVIGQGLESLQAAVDRVKAGVSAMKVCVEIK